MRTGWRLLAALFLIGSLAGCSVHYGVHEMPVLDPTRTQVLGTSTTRSLHGTMIRKATYASTTTAKDPAMGIDVAVTQWGCDEGMSGNLAALGVAAATIFAPPLQLGMAGAGIAATEYAKSQQDAPKVSHEQPWCQAFPWENRPPPDEPAKVPPIDPVPPPPMTPPPPPGEPPT